MTPWDGPVHLVGIGGKHMSVIATLLMEKGVAPSNEVRIVDVNGEDALWLGGAHYLLIAPDPSLEGDTGQRGTRTASSVLLWDEDGVTYRVESELSMAQAIALAEGLVPPATPVPEPEGTPSET